MNPLTAILIAAAEALSPTPAPEPVPSPPPIVAPAPAPSPALGDPITIVVPEASSTVAAVPTIDAVFGDSLLYSAMSEYQAIQANPHAYAKPGWAIQHWESAIYHYARNVIPPSNIILALGTNDATLPVHSPPVWDRVFDNLKLTGACVVVLDHRLTRPVDYQWAANMEAVYAEHPEVKRFPWRVMADANPQWFLFDGIHLNQNGQNNYAYAVWLADKMCDE